MLPVTAHAVDIVGYAYRAEVYCPACIEALTEQGEFTIDIFVHRELPDILLGVEDLLAYRALQLASSASARTRSSPTTSRR